MAATDTRQTNPQASPCGSSSRTTSPVMSFGNSWRRPSAASLPLAFTVSLCASQERRERTGFCVRVVKARDHQATVRRQPQ